jgi:enterochelin esterase-like enzyme
VIVLGRRAFAVAVGAVLSACSRGEASGDAPPLQLPSSPNVRLLEWDLGSQRWGQARVVVVVPTWGGSQDRFPVLVALHGRGEAVKRPAEGALGWPRDYAMVHAIDRLRAPPLQEADYLGFADPTRVRDANTSLGAHPYGGAIVVCPWLPDMRTPPTGDLADYARYVRDILLPRVRRDTPALASPEATGIDGVSLGGVAALRIGLSCPETFGAVGGIQPAIAEGQNADWTALAQAARAARPGLKLRLLTSREDYFRDAIAGVSRTWTSAGVAHDFADVPGPHDYVFNRGPGALELLLWHDRALARA